jgi:hypothetical protein
VLCGDSHTNLAAGELCEPGGPWGDHCDGGCGVRPSVFARDGTACGIDYDANIVCWGHNYAMQASPPAGPHLVTSQGYEHGCALDLLGEAVCWGNTAPQPDGE